MADHSHRDDVGGFLVKKAHIAQNTERITNYTTEKKQALTRKMWGFVVYLLYCDIFSYIATATLLQHYKQKKCVEIAYLSFKRHLRRF